MYLVDILLANKCDGASWKEIYQYSKRKNVQTKVAFSNS